MASEPHVPSGGKPRGWLRRVFSLTLIVTAFGIAAGAAAASDVPQIRVLSNRADLVSGGDALVEIVWPGGLPPASVRVDVNGRDVTEAFGVRPNARYVGVVTGLTIGDNIVTARAPDGSGARITITNH